MQNLHKIVVWQCVQYIFLKSETSFKILGNNVVICHPAMVSMSKTQLTIRQNINQTMIWPNFVILPEGTSRIFKKMSLDFAKSPVLYITGAKSISGNRIHLGILESFWKREGHTDQNPCYLINNYTWKSQNPSRYLKWLTSQ